jgi:cell filamentation protein
VSDDPYVYPGTSVLRNRLGTTDPDYLDKQERALVVLRMRGNIPGGSFDLTHLRAIHRHLFQDVYDWAGELRTVEISKGRQQFQFRKFIETGMANVHGRLVRSRFLKELSATSFAGPP